jgi:hypothetical protein
MDSMDSEFLTTKDVAKLLRCSVQALHNNRFGGSGIGSEIPYYRLGKKIVYRFKDVESYLQRNRVEPE